MEVTTTNERARNAFFYTTNCQFKTTHLFN